MISLTVAGFKEASSLMIAFLHYFEISLPFVCLIVLLESFLIVVDWFSFLVAFVLPFQLSTFTGTFSLGVVFRLCRHELA